MKKCAFTMGALVLAGSLTQVAGLAAEQQAEPAKGAAAEAPALSRADAIRQTLAGIDKELKDHGGTWEAWGAGLKPYRDDIAGCATNWQKFKWPWPAKDGYVFDGSEIRTHLMDNLGDRPEGERHLEAIVHFNKQLQARGVDLMVAFIPSKLSIQPEYLYAAVEGEPQRAARAPEDRQVSVAVKRLMKSLLENDVEVIDLHTAFREFRKQNGDSLPLFYVADNHFVNRGARLTAEKIAERLKRYDFVQKALAGENPYIGEKGSRSDGKKTDNDLLLIKNKKTGEFYRDAGDSPVIVAGDSHLMYNPGKAELSAQVARLIGLPVTTMAKEGLAGEIPLRVAQDSNLARRRVIVTVYTERMLPGKSKWPLVDLPGAAAVAAKPSQTEIKDAAVTGIVAQVSPLPDTKADYPHYIMKFYVTGLADKAGKPVGAGDGIVCVLSMHNRKILPIAALKKDQPIGVRLSSWSLVEKKYGKIKSGMLAVDLELGKPQYWGEAEGQPQLTAEELLRVGQDDGPERAAAMDGGKKN